LCFAFVGVGPAGDQWSDEEKASFSQQFVDKTFIIYIQPRLDAVRATSATEDCWTVVLVESLPNKTFRYAHSVLASKCPGVKTLQMPTVY